MIKKLQFAPLDYLVRTLVGDENLLSLEPFVAGGFPLALFSVLKEIDTSEDWVRLHDQVNLEGFSAISANFGDIDFYFLPDGPVWNSEYKWLVSDRTPGQPTFAPENPFGFDRSEPAFYRKWANVYVKNQNGERIRFQFVKLPQVSVESCLDSFDLMVCCIAWHRGDLYVHESLEDAFDAREVRANSEGFRRRSEMDLYARMFTALRVYKYAERLSFSISKELSEYCDEVYGQTRSVDLESSEPLRDQQDRPTRNPVPASRAFQKIYQRFRQKYESRAGSAIASNAT